jgi:hypothetical protein
MIIGVSHNTLSGVLVEILKIGQDNLDLVQQEACVDVDPFLDLDLQGISQR